MSKWERREAKKRKRMLLHGTMQAIKNAIVKRGQNAKDAQSRTTS